MRAAVNTGPRDIVLLGTAWNPRALLRAQLNEEGFDVVATETWPDMRRHLRIGSKPQLAIVDLQGLPDPQQVLEDLRVLMKPERVMVLSALGTLTPDEIERFGFRVLKRPIIVDDVVRAAKRSLAA
jgi:DNA-binding response OmpR family regulator